MSDRINDILLYLTSYPTRTPDWALAAAVNFAERHNAHISSVLCQTHIPAVSNWLADKLVHAKALIASENARSREASMLLLSEFAGLVSEDRRGEQFLIDAGPLGSPQGPACIARTHDLTIVPASPELEFQPAAEIFIFGSGRSTMILPQPQPGWPTLNRVVIGWDGGRSAARALREALPLCRLAGEVELVTVSGDKPFDHMAALTDAKRHLQHHGIASLTTVIEAGAKDAGTALMIHAEASEAALLVMGAYGHSKAREFVLGGATRSVLASPQLPILLVH